MGLTGLGLVVLLGAGYAGFLWWQNRSERGPSVDGLPPCEPAEVSEAFQLSNPRNLSGELTEDTYFASGEEYTIAERQRLIVPEGVTLIIEPGARVRFGREASLTVQGTLLACGRENRRILFTADAETGTPGFWGGLYFEGADPDSVIGHATIEFAGFNGYAGIYMRDHNTHIEDVLFSSNASWSIGFDPNNFPRVLQPLTIESGPKGWFVNTGEITTVQNWQSPEPLIVGGALGVGDVGRLSIAAGTDLRFMPGGSFWSTGEVKVNGTAGEPVVMTLYNENEREGSPDPAPGGWGGLGVYGRGATSRFSYLEVRFAGDSGIQPGCVTLGDSAPIFDHLTIADCGSFALSTDIYAEPVFDHLTLEIEDPVGAWELRESVLEGRLERTLQPIHAENLNTMVYPLATGWVGVDQDAGLTLAPGMKLFFNASGLWVNGSLTVPGTVEEPVLLTSWRDADAGGEGGAAPGDWGGLHFNSSQPDETIVQHVEIRYGGRWEDAQCLRLLEASPTLENITIRDCQGYPISSDAASEPAVTNLNLSENSQGNYLEIRGSELVGSRSRVWNHLFTSDGGPIIRLVTGVIKIAPEASLQLDPGLTLLFAGEAGIWAQGGLLANGHPDQPILMTSWRDPAVSEIESGAQPGDWAGIALEGGQNLMRLVNTQIRFAGSERNRIGCLNLSNTEAILESLSIANCAYYPVVSDLTSTSGVENLFLTDNFPANEWAVRESALAAGIRQTWVPIPSGEGQAAINRIALGRLTIMDGAQFDIAPGVVVKFLDQGLTVHGDLEVVGTIDQPVIFTSTRDPEFGDGGAQPGDWTGLLLNNPNSQVSLSHLEIRFAGRDQSPRGSIAMLGGIPHLSSVTIRDGAWYPLSIDIVARPVLDSISLISNTTANAVEIRGSSLTASGEFNIGPWLDADGRQIVRVITGEVLVTENASLRILPEVVVKFSENGKLTIQGGLNVENAVLTALHDDEYGGDTDGFSQDGAKWQGVVLDTRKIVVMNGVQIRHAVIGIWLIDSSPTLEEVTIEYSRESALSGDATSDPRVGNVRLENNGINGLYVRGSTLPQGETHWQMLGDDFAQVVRVIGETLLVGAESTLRIDPGVVVKFVDDAGIIVDGQLFAGEDDGLAVVLTTLADDEYGGDTDGLGSSPRRGSWPGIVANQANTDVNLSLISVRIRYARIGLTISNLETWNYSNLLLESSEMYGLSCDSSFVWDSEGDDGILLVDNGLEFNICPTPDQEE